MARNEERLLTFWMNVRAERNGSQQPERHSRNTPNQTVPTQNATRRAAHTCQQSEPALSKTAANARFPMRTAQQWTRCVICWTPNNRKQRFSATVWLFLSSRSIDRLLKCEVAVHNWGLVIWRNTNHTSLLARPFGLNV